MRVIHVGTSGWQYDDWRGPFYPNELAQRKWLEFYSSHFRTVEVNNSFYRLPERETFERWRDQTPSGFIVSVKASRFITHMKRLRDPEEPVALLWERATGLGDRLGPVLFQLPPRFPVEVERLRHLLSVLPKGMRPAFEFRDPSWYTDDVFLLLDDAGAALVWPDRPGLRHTLPALGGWLYVRFHQGTTRGSGLSPREAPAMGVADRGGGCPGGVHLLQQRPDRRRDPRRPHDDRAPRLAGFIPRSAS